MGKWTVPLKNKTVTFRSPYLEDRERQEGQIPQKNDQTTTPSELLREKRHGESSKKQERGRQYQKEDYLTYI